MAFEFKFPDVGEGIHEGEIVRWRVKAGDEVKEDDVLCEMETAKAIVEIPSPKTGTILHLEGNEGDTVKVGALLAVIGEKGEEWENKNTGKQEAAAKAGQAGEEAGNKKQEAAPGVVGSFSNDVSISLPGRAPQPAAQPAVPAAKQPATKTGGIMGAARGQSAQAAPAASPVSSPAPAAPKHPPLQTTGPSERIPLKGIRKAIADHMTESMHTIPHVTHMDELDATHLVGLRTSQKDDAEKQGIKLSYLAYIVEAAAAVLKKHPSLNAAFDAGTNEIIYKKYYNLGIAVDTESGLMVPTIKNADAMNVFDLSRTILDLATRARARKLTGEEMQDATFTITSIGSIGGMYATPIIPVGQSAILGVMRMTEKPVAIDGKVEVRPMMPLVLSYDHRIVDGADAARFMNDLIAELQK